MSHDIAVNTQVARVLKSLSHHLNNVLTYRSLKQAITQDTTYSKHVIITD